MAGATEEADIQDANEAALQEFEEGLARSNYQCIWFGRASEFC
jgi:hypothetical protein